MQSLCSNKSRSDLSVEVTVRRGRRFLGSPSFKCQCFLRAGRLTPQTLIPAKVLKSTVEAVDAVQIFKPLRLLVSSR